MAEFDTLEPKTYIYLTNDNDENLKIKKTVSKQINLKKK